MQINLLNCKFFESTGEPPAFQTIDQLQSSRGLPGYTVHFDWLKVWKAGAPVLPKNLKISLQNRVNSLGFRIFCGTNCKSVFDKNHKVHSLEFDTSEFPVMRFRCREGFEGARGDISYSRSYLASAIFTGLHLHQALSQLRRRPPRRFFVAQSQNI